MTKTSVWILRVIPDMATPYNAVRVNYMIAPGAGRLHCRSGPGDRLVAMSDLRRGGTRRVRRAEGAPSDLPAPGLGGARRRGDLAQRRRGRAGSAGERAAA